jgi:hypothetical protein
MMIDQRNPNPVMFSQLKELKIERNVDDVVSLEEVLCFIRASPSLERLCISLLGKTSEMEVYFCNAINVK